MYVHLQIVYPDIQHSAVKIHLEYMDSCWSYTDYFFLTLFTKNMTHRVFHNIYIGFYIISNVEKFVNTGKEMCMFYANIWFIQWTWVYAYFYIPVSPVLDTAGNLCLQWTVFSSLFCCFLILRNVLALQLLLGSNS